MYVLEAKTPKDLIYETVVEKTQFAVMSSTSGTTKTTKKLTPNFLMKDNEGRDIVAAKQCGYEDLECYVPIETKKIQTLVSKTFREVIGSKDNLIRLGDL
jgi:hypothetical protein